MPRSSTTTTTATLFYYQRTVPIDFSRKISTLFHQCMTLLLSTIVAVAVANHHFRCTHHVSPLPLLHLLITIWLILILILKMNSNLIFTDRNYSHCCWDFSSYYNTPSISVNATLEVVAVVSLDPSTYNLSTDLRTSSAPINNYAWCHKVFLGGYAFYYWKIITWHT